MSVRTAYERDFRVVLWLASLILMWFTPSHVYAAARLEVGYVPILPMAQLYVMQGEGWTNAAGLDVRTSAFAEGPGIIQALNDGKVDIAYFGIAPAMLAVSKGVDIKVVATNVVEQVALMARGDLTFYMLTDPVAGLKRFAAKKKRPARIACFPVGSVPDAVFRFWLLEVAKLPLDSVDVVAMGASDMQAALLAGTVDGALGLEPILTVVAAQDRSAKVVLDGAEMMPNQPGAILAARGATIRKQPQAVHKFVELHYRATEFLIREPDRAAKHAFAALSSGQSQLTLALIEKAMTSRYSKFVADPYRIMDSTQVMYAFQLKTGVLAQPIKIEQLFDTRFFDRASDGRKQR